LRRPAEATGVVERSDGPNPDALRPREFIQISLCVHEILTLGCRLERMENKNPSGKGHKPATIKTIALVGIGVLFAAAGIYVGETDDAPGAALLGVLLMTGMVVLAVKIARHKPVQHPRD
jgi:hypothetical protein